MAIKKLTIGARGSQLAVTQTQWVISRLREANPGLEIEFKTIKTMGDKDAVTPLTSMAGIGVFVKELRTALLSGEIDCAVHSLKDVPEEQPEGLALVSYPAREDARDVLVSNGDTFSKLPPGARVGTGSPRRIMQLRALRSDLKYVPMRGNLDTRIRKVREKEVDAVIAAAAGINRLGRPEDITHSFSFDQIIPAIGQGALVLECREGDKTLIRSLRTINDDLTEAAVLIERDFMGRVGGGCKVPMACHVYLSGGLFRIMAAIGDLKSGKICRVEQTSEGEDIEECLNNVVSDILEDCRLSNVPIPADLPDHHLLNE